MHNIAMNKSKIDVVEQQPRVRSAPKHAKCSRQLRTLDVVELNRAWEGHRELLIPESNISVLEIQCKEMIV